MAENERNRSQSGQGQQNKGEENKEEFSLKEREYRGEDGQIHHHTNEWMRDHKGEKGQQQSREGARGKKEQG